MTVRGQSPERRDENGEEVITVDTSLVAFPVTVLDRDGRFIPGLTKKDFEIFENNSKQQIQNFESVESPFTVVLMLDVSASTRYRIDEIHNAAIKFVSQLRDTDKVMVIEFDTTVRILCEATMNRPETYAAIKRAAFGGNTSLYESVDTVIENQLKKMSGRRAVVIFSDGIDTTSKRSTYESSLGNAEETEALFYPVYYDTSDFVYGSIGRRKPVASDPGPQDLSSLLNSLLGGRIPLPPQYRPVLMTSSNDPIEGIEIGRRYLSDLAFASGGRVYDAGNNLDAAFLAIAEELRRQYTVGYYSDNSGTPGDRRSIRVKVNRPNAVVRAKKSYIVGSGRPSADR